MTRPRINIDETVLDRLKGGDTLDSWYRKVHALRRVVAGDLSHVLNSRAPSASKSDAPGTELRMEDLYDFIVVAWDQAYSNRLLEAVRQLMMTVTYSRPDVEFEDLPAKIAIVNSFWVKSILSEPPIGCAAVDSMRMAFMDYCIGGMGWSCVGLRQGAPILDWVDSLDVKWDRRAKTPAQIRWASCKYRESMDYWIDMFGWQAMSPIWNTSGQSLDTTIELEFYFDRDINGGQAYVCHGRPGTEAPHTIIDKNPNPWYFDVAGQRRPVVPLTPLYFQKMPSTTEPMGLVEQMFPDQRAIWQIEEYDDTAIERGKPFWKAPQGTFADDTERKKFIDGEIGTLVELARGDITPSEPLQMPAELYNRLAYREKRLTAKGGMNPYAAGAPQGVDYAAEVHEISSMSGIVSGYAAEDDAMFWTQSVRKLLMAGALYDDRTIEVPVAKGVYITFDAFNPIKSFLRPQADLIISADKKAFRPRAQKIAEAAENLNVALSLQSIFPQAVPRAYEKYLRATGELDVQGYLEGQMTPQIQDPASALSSTSA